MYVNMTLGIDTKVDAINAVLESIGSVGINAPSEIDWNIDAADADKMIDNISQKIQANMGKGWWFNREEFHEFAPDPVNGNVVVPNNTLACFIKRRDGKIVPITTRGKILFDSKNLGYDMRKAVDRDGKIKCILVVNLDFETLPATARHAVVDAACYWTVNNKEGDQIKLRSYKDASDQSIVALQAENASQARRNMFNNGWVRSQVSKVGGYNNN